MSEMVLWELEPTYRLKEISLFNWGGFAGAHHAQIDANGTAVIGPTGSGKTTLVDALMTLLCANAKYNLASTGGHESDRDMVSYVRGVSGAGDGVGGQSHIARSGKTVTGIAVTLHNGESLARLGAVMWFDGTSSSPSDMKKLWFFSTAPEQTLENWLTLQYEGGMRALRQLDKTETGISTFTSKKSYLARIRDFFEVRENAFNLLNRAAGLKQLNSIDEIFRELVLDDTSQFDRAAEVADSFDDLTAIHEELEIARQQLRSLEPVKITWEKHLDNESALTERKVLRDILPIWYAEQAYYLWKAEFERLEIAVRQADAALLNGRERQSAQEQLRDNLKEVYLKLGGSSIETLEDLIAEKQKNLDQCRRFGAQYQHLAQSLKLPDSLTREQFIENKASADIGITEVGKSLLDVEARFHKVGGQHQNAKQHLDGLQTELDEVKQRRGSNIPSAFHHFRLAMAEALGLDETALPYVGELVEVKEEHQEWRGAIERAIGNHRLRILVPPQSIDMALSWVNNRHNALHVRILQVKEPDSPAEFWHDGYTRKLAYKPHAYRETVKAFLATIDRHCVASPELLKTTPYAMTQLGLMSGKARFYEKQDQKRLDQDWLTGFDNRDRVAFLQQEINLAKDTTNTLIGQTEQIKSQLTSLTQQQQLWQQLRNLDFETINIPYAEQEVLTQEQKLAALTAPDTHVSAAKQKLKDAEAMLKQVSAECDELLTELANYKKDHKLAETEKRKAFRKSEAGLNGEQRQLATDNFAAVDPAQLSDIGELESQATNAINDAIDGFKNIATRLEKELVKQMSDAKKVDRGALAEVGRELDDVPDYLARLKVLIEEALPAKRARFKEYLNRSSDEGVTQLLMTIDSEVDRIEEKLDEVNHTLRRVDFQSGRYLQLVSNKVIHESLRSFDKTRAKLASARFNDDEGESQYKALREIVSLLRDACERKRVQASKALLDPRFRLEFKVSVVERASGEVIETRSGSQGGSGGEKEIIASYVLTASLSYALCPDGSSRPLFGTIVLDEAFSRSSHAVAGRIIAALREFGLHALFITPNKEMRLLRKHTRSAIVVHRRGIQSTLTPLSWEELDEISQRRMKQPHEISQ